MYAWAQDGIYISEVMNLTVNGQVVNIWGTGHKTSLFGDGHEGVTHYLWRARITPHGWEVTVESPSARRETFQGATFNLVLEVATAIKRTL